LEIITLNYVLYAQGLNLWAALGADSEENEDSVKTSVMQKMAKAVGATAVVTSDVLSAVASYNPVSLMYK
jgi:hypothetical protein